MKENNSDIIFGLNDNPPFLEKIFAALQHLCAIFIPIMAPGYIICGSLNCDFNTTSVIISMCLLFSGIGTFIQTKKIGILGSGLLSIQGTSAAFISVLIIIGQNGGLSLIFGSSLVGALLLVIIGPFIKKLQRFFPPLVTGTVVILIGITLIPIAVESCAGGNVAKLNSTYGTAKNLILSLIVIIIIILAQCSKNKYIKISSIVIALLIGFIISYFMGMVDFSSLAKESVINIPKLFNFGLSFKLSALIPILIIYFVSCIESVGDITATSLVSNEPYQGDLYMKRVSGGILGCGVISFIGNIFSALPLTTFSQNNGIIQITGVASRHVGYYVAFFLIITGFSPIIGGAFALIPAPVIGTALLMMFGSIAAAGIKILSKTKLNKRGIIILSASLGIGLSVNVPDILNRMPEIIQISFSSGIATGGLTAIILNALIANKQNTV